MWLTYRKWGNRLMNWRTRWILPSCSSNFDKSFPLWFKKSGIMLLVWFYCLIILRAERNFWMTMLIYCRLQDTWDSKHTNYCQHCVIEDQSFYLYQQPTFSLYNLYFTGNQKDCNVLYRNVMVVPFRVEMFIASLCCHQRTR